MAKTDNDAVLEQWKDDLKESAENFSSERSEEVLSTEAIDTLLGALSNENMEKYPQEHKAEIEAATERFRRKLYGEQNVLEKMDKLESEYDIYAAECKAGLQKVLLVTQNLYDAINRSGERNPIDRFESRIKTFKSVKGKCRVRGYEMTMESVRRNVKDIAGIRIITKYIDEVMVVKEAISRMSGIYIANIKDYVSKPKPNGYRSVHLDCQVEVYDPYKGYILVPVEIQIRSKSMNLWATLEHDLKYKNSNPSPDVEEKFKRIAKILEDFDQEAIALRDYSGPHDND